MLICITKQFKKIWIIVDEKLAGEYSSSVIPIDINYFTTSSDLLKLFPSINIIMQHIYT